MNYIIYTLAAIGGLAICLFVVGFWLDFRDFDRTSGGYEPPYEGVVGDPIDWFALDRTPTGLARRGYILNTLVDGTSGMISFEIYGIAIPFRPMSERALVVHKPREAFKALGFNPAF
ncbi:MAG: hypothetical protein QNJ35_17760 [Paracoccaceae bacterium]|nr:hypothetical protein [Paracoccaceae bacterium]